LNTCKIHPNILKRISFIKYAFFNTMGVKLHQLHQNTAKQMKLICKTNEIEDNQQMVQQLFHVLFIEHKTASRPTR
jgi:hypothetical protein